MTEKAKPTVTGSQVEAFSSSLEPLYATVNKERKNTRTSLDFGERRLGGQTASVTQPPRDWVVGGKSDATQSDGVQFTAVQVTQSNSAGGDNSHLPSPVSTSSPKRVAPSPLPKSRGSGGPGPSSSYENIQSTANQTGGEPIKPPSPRQPDAAAVASAESGNLETHVARYRAMYSFTAEQETEVSMNEGDLVDGIPGELPSNGWLLVEVGGQRGLVPESYLEEREGGEVGGGRREGSVERKRAPTTSPEVELGTCICRTLHSVLYISPIPLSESLMYVYIWLYHAMRCEI